MKPTQLIFSVSILIAATFSISSAWAQSCYLADDGSVTVEDRSIPNQKRLWEACIDRKLAQLDPRRPDFFERGQEIGDVCTSSQIICE